MSKEEIIQILRNKFYFYLGCDAIDICDILREILEEIGADHDLPM